MKKTVLPSREYLEELTELISILVSKGYFSSKRYAKQYVSSLNNYVRGNIGISPSKSVPSFFSKYGKDLKYITYVHSSHTTWYILFEETEDTFFLRHITNNHVSGQYFNI